MDPDVTTRMGYWDPVRMRSASQAMKTEDTAQRIGNSWSKGFFMVPVAYKIEVVMNV